MVSEAAWAVPTHGPRRKQISSIETSPQKLTAREDIIVAFGVSSYHCGKLPTLSGKSCGSVDLRSKSSYRTGGNFPRRNLLSLSLSPVSRPQ